MEKPTFAVYVLPGAVLFAISYFIFNVVDDGGNILLMLLKLVAALGCLLLPLIVVICFIWFLVDCVKYADYSATERKEQERIEEEQRVIATEKLNRKEAFVKELKYNDKKRYETAMNSSRNIDYSSIQGWWNYGNSKTCYGFFINGYLFEFHTKGSEIEAKYYVYNVVNGKLFRNAITCVYYDRIYTDDNGHKQVYFNKHENDFYAVHEAKKNLQQYGNEVNIKEPKIINNKLMVSVGREFKEIIRVPLDDVRSNLFAKMIECCYIFEILK